MNYVLKSLVFYATFLPMPCKSRINKELTLDCLFHSKDCHKKIVDNFYKRRSTWLTSNLGSMLYKNVGPEHFIETTYVVVVDWNDLVKGHVFSHVSNEAILNDVLKNCFVKNCKFTTNKEYIYLADAVVMTVAGLTTSHTASAFRDRQMHQRWILLSEETPIKIFEDLLKHRKHCRLRHRAHLFNWTMTYRSDSDVPIPYGRTIPLEIPLKVSIGDARSTLAELVPFWHEKQFSTLANVIISDCNIKRRMNYLAEIQEHMKIGGFGKCYEFINKSCPGHAISECKPTRKYLFYLAFESASCRQYLSNDHIVNGYSKGAIPVIMGPPLEDCDKLLPPNSFLHVENYKTVEDLVKHMKKIAADFDILLKYHEWRIHFQVLNEHGHFRIKTPFFCRVCEALNFNDKDIKVYSEDDLELFFNHKILCDVNYV